MRTPVALALVTICLGLAGCSLFGKKQGAHTKTDPKPFLGTETPTKTETPIAPAQANGPLPGANGFLAGRVVALSTGNPVNARIEVRDLENLDAKTAKLDVETVEGGYFTIQGLKPGGHYQLIARGKEGGELMSARQIVKAPNVSLYFRLSKQNTGSDTPPVPETPAVPDKKGTTGTGSSQERIPATTLDPPVKLPPSKEPAPRDGDTPAPPSDNGMGASQTGGNSSNISNIAKDFPRVPAPPTVEVPGPQPHRSAPWPSPPPLGDWQSVPDDRAPQSTPPGPQPKPSGSVHLPDVPTRIPSCGLYGDRLNNFALRDERGDPWEYKRDFHGKLMLLDFWYTSCPNCLATMHHLVELQRDYKPYGLEVVGIACETGPIAQQRERVSGARGRYYINYKTLLSGGYFEKCPVVKQFQVERYPTLVLIDNTGKIIWRSEGLEENGYKVLKKLIENKLLASRSP
ncbi:MAG TPA: redoxin family protein [Gemmataceae bacterium]